MTGLAARSDRSSWSAPALVRISAAFVQGADGPRVPILTTVELDEYSYEGLRASEGPAGVSVFPDTHCAVDDATRDVGELEVMATGVIAHPREGRSEVESRPFR